MSIAKKFVSPAITFDNLLAEGNLTLLGVIERFNWQLGFCFSTYATRVLRNRFMNIHLKERAHRAHIKDIGGDSYLKEAADSRRDYLPPLVQARLKESIECCLDGRERTVIELRFGLETGKGMTLRAIGEMLELTRERVRQIERKALDKLFKNIDSDGELLDCVSDTLSSEWIALREQREQQEVESLGVLLVQHLAHSQREAKLAHLMDWGESLPEKEVATERILKALQFLDSQGWLVRNESDNGCIFSLNPSILAIAVSHTPRISHASTERLSKLLAALRELR
jgi:RNA polymerase sigma factor (sigma-70 family)